MFKDIDTQIEEWTPFARSWTDGEFKADEPFYDLLESSALLIAGGTCLTACVLAQEAMAA